jgi:hypothetical protein
MSVPQHQISIDPVQAANLLHGFCEKNDCNGQVRDQLRQAHQAIIAALMERNRLLTEKEAIKKDAP